MDRREYLTGVGSAAAMLTIAGCTETGDDPATTSRGPDQNDQNDQNDESSGTSSDGDDASGGQELPGVEELLEKHYDSLDERSFAAEDRSELSYSHSDESQVTEQSVRHSTTGTLVETTEQGETETKWFDGHVRITPHTHRYESSPITLPFAQRRTLETALEILSGFEQVETIEGDVRKFVFEATEGNEAAFDGESVSFHETTGRLTIAEAGYIHSLDSTITVSQSDDSDKTTTLQYEYEVTSVGDVTTSKPSFADDAVRVTGSITADESAVVMKHEGGPAVSKDARIVVEGPRATDMEVALDAPFEPGDRAYVYWTEEEKAAISVNEEPSNVARAMALSDDQNIYIQGTRRTAMRGQFMLDLFHTE